jgi:hypothetical protein
VGQVSILNTFCHIHTPLLISFWRNVLGLVLGAGVGAVAFLALDFGRAFFAPPTEAEKEEAEAQAESAGETYEA